MKPGMTAEEYRRHAERMTAGEGSFAVVPGPPQPPPSAQQRPVQQGTAHPKPKLHFAADDDETED